MAEPSVYVIAPVPIHAAPVSTEVMDRFAAIARDLGISAVSYACVCHQPQDILPLFAVGEATLVVGGARGHQLAQTDEQHLAETLERHGHHVVFAEAGGDDGVPLDS